MRFFLGAYTSDREGAADGIGVLCAGSADDALAGGELAFGGSAVRAASPSWLAWHPTQGVVYAAQEAAGTVRAFARTGEESFAPLGAAVPVGSTVCHVATSPSGRSLVASCYGDGRVVAVPLAADGALIGSEVAVGDVADDAYADLGMSARAPHAHQARFVPGALVSTDLGADSVRVWAATGGALNQRQAVVLPRGSGPRHTVWHPSGHLYVVTEYSNEVFVLRPAASGAWSLVAGTQIIGTQEGVDFPAEIALSRDAAFVSVSIRGSNTIAVLRVGSVGSALTTVALVESGVDWPRHHVIERDTLLVAGQRSNDITSLTIDERTGVPGRVRRRVEAPSPAMLLADR